MSELYEELIRALLPVELVDYFDLTKSEKVDNIMHLYFEEFNKPPSEFDDLELVAHGFHKEITVQDFPLRGMRVYLHIKRRRWLVKITKELVQRNWDLVAKGTRMTEEFASFLKELSR